MGPPETKLGEAEVAQRKLSFRRGIGLTAFKAPPGELERYSTLCLDRCQRILSNAFVDFL
jgi:hypothetical protein